MPAKPKDKPVKPALPSEPAKPEGAKAQSPKLDPTPAAPALTAKMVMSVSRLQNEVGRLSRLRVLARTNADVAWLMTQAEKRAPLADPK
jgi:hypothetical protein